MKLRGFTGLHRPKKIKRVPITLLYNPAKNMDKLTRAYALVTRTKILTINWLLNPGTGTRILELARRVGIPVKDLIDKRHPGYAILGENDMSDEDWAKLLLKQPDLLKTPIVIKGDKAVILKRPKDIFRI